MARGSWIVHSLVALALGAGACVEDSQDGWARIRLVDHIDAARVVSAVDAADPAALLRDHTEILEREEFDAAAAASRVLGPEFLGTLFPGTEPAAGTPRSPATWSGGTLRIEGAGVYLQMMPLEPGTSVRAELTFAGTPPERIPPFLVELTEPLDPDRLADAEFVRRELFPRLVRRHLFRLEAAVALARRTGLVSFVGRPDTRALLFVAIAESGLTLDRLVLHRQPRLATVLLAAEPIGTHPCVRQVGVDREHREAIVLGLPGEVAFVVDVPPGEPRLTLAAAALTDGREPVHVTAVAASADCGAPLVLPAVTIATRARPARWEELVLDLQPLAGRRAEIRLTGRAAPGAGLSGVALGTPVVDALPPPDADLPPDVVFISLDTVRPDRLSLYGNPRPTSPRLAALGSGGAVFENAVAPSPWTLPSHVSVFTGQLPGRHGVTTKSRRLDAGRSGHLARTLRAAGYRTVAFTAGGFVHPDFGLATGFERYVSDELVRCAEVDGTVQRVARTRRRDDLLALAAAPRRAPLFLFVHTYGAHDYGTCPADLRALGTPEDELRELAPLLRPGAALELVTTHLPGEIKAADVRRLPLLYDASLRGVDALAGDVVAALCGGGREPWVFVFSDHGEELHEHGRFGHDFGLHEELIRVPLVVLGPQVVPRRVRPVVSLADLAPTVVDLLGLPAAPAFDGRSLAPVLRGRRIAAEPALSQVAAPVPMDALRGERWKLVAERRETGCTYRLYDLREDPGEDVDLAEERPNVVQRLAQALEERLAAFGDGVFEELVLDAERIAELKELGYLGGK